MFKSIELQSRHLAMLIVVAALLIVTLGMVALGIFSPVQAAPSTQAQDTTSSQGGTHHGGTGMGTPGMGMTDTGLMDRDMISMTISMAEMGAMMDEMMTKMYGSMSTMPMSGTMMPGTVMPGMMMHNMMMSGMMPMASTMPISSTMSVAEMGEMVQMMSMMQMHLTHMQMMMGVMMSGEMMGFDMMHEMMDDKMGHASDMEMPSEVPLDVMFIDGMIEHHQGAIDMAEMALEQAEHEEILTLATEIIAAQTVEIEQMQSWRSEWYPDLAPTSGMSMSMGDMAVREDASLPFDQRFIEAMISHHQGAIDMAGMVLERADHAEIRTLAAEIIVAQTTEIEQMQSWLADWYEVGE